MVRMRDKFVLITGSARGIGLCTARHFVHAGCRVILTDRDADALESARESLAEDGEVATFCYDVAKRGKVEEMAKEVMSRFGTPDILINNAGIGYNGELAQTTYRDWKKLMDVNFWGVLHHVYAFLPAMTERGTGHVINISSGQVYFMLPTWGAYTATKAALGVFSEVLHFEMRKHGIKVTTVYPFMVDTGFYDNAQPDTFGARLSMKLLPYYAMTPEKVGKIIFKAAVKGRRVERVTFINDLGSFARALPISGIIGWAGDLLLTGKKGT